jgi:hydroxymethylpyrimidine pyrophosphatase-like HAD family hydrolase
MKAEPSSPSSRPAVVSRSAGIGLPQQEHTTVFVSVMLVMLPYPARLSPPSQRSACLATQRTASPFRLATLNLVPSPPRLIAIDMDGTLLNSSAEVSPRNLAALTQARAAGAEIVIATGRRHCYAMNVLRGLDLDPAHALISSNGTVIRTLGHQLLHRSHLPITTARWLCAHAAEFRSTLVLTFDKVTPSGEDARGALVGEQIEALHASIARWMQINAPYFEEVDRLEDALPLEQDPHALGDTAIHHPPAPIQAMICGPIDRMERAEARLLEDPRITGVGLQERPGAEIALHRTIYPDRDLSIVDILPAGCSKASALTLLAHHRGVALADVLAIGDNWNDVPMLEIAGRSALMANAPQELHERAAREGWQVVPGNDHDGVAIAIETSLA